MEEGRTDHQHALRPVTLRQIRDASRLHSDAPFEIDGKEVRTICTVAQLLRESFVLDGRKAVYVLNDGTCQLDAWHLLPAPVSGEHDGEHFLDDGSCYVRIVGYISLFRVGQPSITVNGIHKVKDGNEVLHHYMEAMLAKLSCEHGRPSTDVMRSARTKAAQDATNAAGVDPLNSWDGSSQAPPLTPRTGTQMPPYYSFSSEREVRGRPSPAAQQSSPTSRPPTTPQGTPGRRYEPRSNYAPSPSYRTRTSSSSTPEGKSPFGAKSSSSSSQPRQPQAAARPSAHSLPQTQPSATFSRPPSTPTPDSPTASRGQTGQGTSRLGRDPLSYLTGLQRQIMLKIMNSEPGTSRGGVHVKVITKSLMTPEGITADAVADGIDALVERGLIEATSGDCLYYRAVEDGGGYGFSMAL